MPEVREHEQGRFDVICLRCTRPVIARQEWAGRDVHCPHCHSVIRIPTPPVEGRTVMAEPPGLSVRHYFNFACPQCKVLLEAHTGMCAQRATCPTCAARFVVPHLKPNSKMPSKAELLEGEAADPAPVHAYAASGVQAPRIVQRADGETLIECPRCNAYNSVDADSCEACSTPFTMDAASSMGKLRRDWQVNASLTLGIVGLLLFFLLLPSLLALWLGAAAALSPVPGRRVGLALLGLSLGLFGLIGGIVFWYVQLL